MSASNYTAKLSPDGTLIEVIDLNLGGRSVTNDAEAVVYEVVSTLGNLPIIYRDSDGCWDELKHVNGRFTDFGMIGADDVELAREFMKERKAR